MQLKEVLEDMKAFGGLPLFCLMIVLSYALGYQQLSWQLVIGIVLAYVVTTSGRIFLFKRRPDGQVYKNFLQKIDAGSFPSLHSMRAAVLATILVVFFDNTFVDVLAVIIVTSVATIRVVQKRHFVIDVIAGALAGVVIALVAVFLQKSFIA